MSWIAVDAVFDLAPDDLSRRELKVLVALARRVSTPHQRPDTIPTCYPYIDRIAADARVSRRTVHRALAELERRGLIAHIRTGRSSLYALTLLADLAMTPTDDLPISNPR